MILGRKAIIEAFKSGEIEWSGAPPALLDKKPNPEFDAWAKARIQPASMDVSIDGHMWAAPVKMRGRAQYQFIDRDRMAIFPHDPERYPKPDEYFIKVDMNEKGIPELLLPGHGRLLAATEHVLKLGPTIAAQVATRSTAKRWGLDVCGSAGWVDPGYQGRVTLEFYNENDADFCLKPGVAYAQLVFLRVEGGEAYDGHYNHTEWKPEMMLPKYLKVES